MLRSLILTVALAGCGIQGVQLSESQDDDRDGLGDSPGLPSDCSVDEDCTLTASSCCGCPTFATSVDANDSCDDIFCPGETECAPAEAVCDFGQCALVCSPVITTKECEGGFVVDEAGCTLDECAADVSECAIDDDCIVVPADCCGCELGGNDTAVAAADEEAHFASLSCDGPVSCPGVSTCDDGSASCLGGRCRYVSGAEIDDGVPCGTAETGQCPQEEQCVLNSTQSGTSSPGLGVCQPE